VTAITVIPVPADCDDCDYASVYPGGPDEGWQRCTEPGCTRVHWVRYCERHLVERAGDKRGEP